MRYPTSSEYQDALQNPEHFLRDPKLHKMRVEEDNRGFPKPYSGTFAVAFRMFSNSGGTATAVRCFKRTFTDVEERYKAISSELKRLKSPYFLEFEYQPEGVLINGSWFPIVKMDWAKGETLKVYLEKHHRDNQRVGALAKEFQAMVCSLRSANIAHGDLQPENIVVTSRGKLKLVDYDGMFVPALAGWKANESGQPHFQHPERNLHFDAGLDRFSAIIIHTSLKLLEDHPDLWQQFHNGQNLIFTQDDFEKTKNSALLSSIEKKDSELASKLKSVFEMPLDRVPTLESFTEVKKKRTCLASLLGE